MLQCQFEGEVICVNLNVVSKALGMMESVATFQPAVSEVANTKSHQARVTKNHPHGHACCEQRSKIRTKQQLYSEKKGRYSDVDGSVSFRSLKSQAIGRSWQFTIIQVQISFNF